MKGIPRDVCLWNKINNFFDLAQLVKFPTDFAKAEILASLSLSEMRVEYNWLVEFLTNSQVECRSSFETVREDRNPQVISL